MESNIVRRCRECESDNIETTFEIYLPANREANMLEIHEAIALSENTGKHYCLDCCSIVETIATLF